MSPRFAALLFGTIGSLSLLGVAVLKYTGHDVPDALNFFAGVCLGTLLVLPIRTKSNV